MIIDFHTHIFPDAIAERAVGSLVKANGGTLLPVTKGTKASLLSRMDEWGIDVSVNLPVLTKPSQTKSTNEWAAAACDSRIVSFGGIHPHTDDYRRDIDFVASLGFKGIKLHAEYQDFVVDAPEMLKLYDYAFSRGLMILHHAGFDPAFPAPYKSTPKQFANIARAMRGGIMIAAHLGGQRQWEDVERDLAGENIYLDTSTGFDFYDDETFLRIVRAHGCDKILFGSDSPWTNAKKEIERIKALPLTKKEKDAILGGNAKRLLFGENA